MTKVLDSINKAGLQESHEPRLFGDILRDYISTSDEPLAVSLRGHEEMEKIIQSNADSYGKK